MALSLGGLASGLDTNTIIEQLIALERRPQAKLRMKQRQIETREAALRDVATRLKNLKSAAAALKSTTLWQDTQTVESSDTARLAGKRVGSAAPGAYQVEVSQLARAEQRTYNYTANAANTTITVSGTVVNIAANSTVEQAAAAVNGTAGITVIASAVGGQLVMTAKSTGTSNAFTATGTTVAEDAPKARVALNAQYTVDGAAKTAQSNAVTDAIVGIELSLKGLTGAGTPITISVGNPGPDKEAVKAKVKAFVDQYNSTVEFIRGKVNEKKVVNPQTEADSLKGMLNGDSLLTWQLSQLRIGAMDPVAGNPQALDELAEIGVTTGGTTGGGAVNQDSVSGRLTLDDAKLTAALDSDPDSVQKLLGGWTGVEGIAQRFGSLVDYATQTGGSIDARLSAARSELTRIKEALTSLDRRIAHKEQLLRAQFKAMEDAFSRSQGQSGWLAGQLGR